MVHKIHRLHNNKKLFIEIYLQKCNTLLYDINIHYSKLARRQQMQNKYSKMFNFSMRGCMHKSQSTTQAGEWMLISYQSKNGSKLHEVKQFNLMYQSHIKN